jgi:hypothetical protein
MMQYQETYTYFYSKYYNKAELLIKHFLIKRENQGKVFLVAFNDVFHYLSDTITKENIINTNEHLKPLHVLFKKRNQFYTKNEVQNIFENEIKEAFNLVPSVELPKNYSYSTLIIEMAILEAITEIARVFSNQSQLMEMFYKANDFSDFEIRTYDNLAIDDSPIYKKLQAQLYPKTNSFNDEEQKTQNEELKNAIRAKPFNRNHWNENCFNLFHYLEGNYDKQGKIKYINIFYFLKDHPDKDRYAFSFTLEQYRQYIYTNFGVQLTKFKKAEYEYDDKVNPILKGFEQDFRQNF